MANPSNNRGPSIKKLLQSAEVAARLGDDVEVVRLLSPRFNLQRPHKELGLALASAYLRLGNTEMALYVAESLDSGEEPDYAASFLLGRIYEARGHYEAASDAYRDALDAEPENVEPRVRLAEMSLRVMDVSAARRWTRLAGVPAGMDPRLNLLAGLALMADGLFVEAQREVQLAADAGLQDDRIAPTLDQLALDIADQQAHLDELAQYVDGQDEGGLPQGLVHADFVEDYVTCLMNLGRRRDALRYVEEASKGFPAEPGVVALRARVLIDSGLYEEGIFLGTRVSELEGDDSFPEWVRQQVEGLAGTPHERHEDYLKRAELAGPEDAARLLANAALMKVTAESPPADAGQLLERALELAPEHHATRLIAALVSHAEGNFAEAAARYRECLERWDDPSVWVGLGGACLGIGDSAEAFQAFRKALELSPDFDTPHMQLALLALANGDLDRAARECGLALDANPNSVPARKLMMECYFRLGRYDDAEDLCMDLIDLPNANLADAYRSLGNIWEARGDTERAIECYSDALAEAPDDPRLLMDIAYLYMRHGQHDEAEEFLGNALKSHPNHPALLDALGRLRVERGRLDEGIKYLARAVRHAPGAFEPLFHLAQAYIGKQKWRSAAEKLKEALLVRPYSAPALAALGRVYCENGMDDLAAQAFRNGLKCDPENFDLLRGLAELHFGEGGGERVPAHEAWNLLRAAVSRAPDPASAQWALDRLDLLRATGTSPQAAPEPAAAEPREPKGRTGLTPLPTPQAWASIYSENLFKELVPYRAEPPEQAERLITRAIQFGVGTPEPFLQRAIVRAHMGRYEEAVPDLTEVIRLSPRRAEVFVKRGILHRALGHEDAAMADFARALELSPRLAHAHEMKGFALLEADRPRDAASEFTSALAVIPESAYSLWGRARALLDMKQPGLAGDDLSAAIGIAPLAPLFNDRGECFRRAGEFEAALMDFDEALKLQPGDPLALENRARTLLALERFEAALADAEAALAKNPGDAQLRALLRRAKGEGGLRRHKAQS